MNTIHAEVCPLMQGKRGFEVPKKRKLKRFAVLLTRGNPEDDSQIEYHHLKIDVPVDLTKKEKRAIWRNYLESLDVESGDRAKAIAQGLPPPARCLAILFCQSYLQSLQPYQDSPLEHYDGEKFVKILPPNQLFLEAATDNSGVFETVGRFASFDWCDDYFGGKALKAY